MKLPKLKQRGQRWQNWYVWHPSPSPPPPLHTHTHKSAVTNRTKTLLLWTLQNGPIAPPGPWILGPVLRSAARHWRTRRTEPCPLWGPLPRFSVSPPRLLLAPPSSQPSLAFAPHPQDFSLCHIFFLISEDSFFHGVLPFLST